MSTSNQLLNTYLTEVKSNLTDRLNENEIEEIISELHAHIWDTAQEIINTSIDLLWTCDSTKFLNLKWPTRDICEVLRYSIKNKSKQNPLNKSEWFEVQKVGQIRGAPQIDRLVWNWFKVSIVDLSFKFKNTKWDTVCWGKVFYHQL